MDLFEIEKPLQTIEEKIKQRRLQILVHSYIYYELNNNIISDKKWDIWSEELKELQQKYPNIAKKVIYAKQFKDWEGSTGAYLKYDNNIKNKAEWLLKIKGVKI